MINAFKKIGLSAVLVLPSTAVISVELTTGQSTPVGQPPSHSHSIDADSISHHDCQGASLIGKAHMTHHFNAALGEYEINKPLLERVNDLNLDASAFTTLTVLSVGDVSYFLQQMAKLKIEDLRRTYADQEFILDKSSSVRSAWGLPKSGPSITLFDLSGKTIAHKGGKFEASDEKEFMALIQQHLAQ